MDKAKISFLKLIAVSLLWIVCSFFLLGGLLFGSAGKIDWHRGWVFMITLICCVGFNMIVLIKKNPEVIEERIRFGDGAKKWDVILTSVFSIFIFITMIVAGLDERYGWSKITGVGWMYLGVILVVFGDLFFLWAMAVNRWFAKLVKIQTERGHKVVTSGPYQYIRHPGYTGWSFLWLGAPLILNSLWALVPAVVSIVLLILRTSWEDQTLQDELPGYPEYASKVKYKLIPGIW